MTNKGPGFAGDTATAASFERDEELSEEFDGLPMQAEAPAEPVGQVPVTAMARAASRAGARAAGGQLQAQLQLTVAQAVGAPLGSLLQALFSMEQQPSALPAAV